MDALGIELAPDWCDLGFEELGPYVLRDMASDPEAVGWWYWWLIQEPADGPEERRGPTLIGYLGFKGPPTRGGNIEVLYAVVPSARHKGLVTEALRELLRWAFDRPPVRCVVATVDPGNEASLRVLAKQGFTRVEAESDEEQLVLRLRRSGWPDMPQR